MVDEAGEDPSEVFGNWKAELLRFDSANSAAFFASGRASECLRACPLPVFPPPLPRGLTFSGF